MDMFTKENMVVDLSLKIAARTERRWYLFAVMFILFVGYRPFWS